MQTTTKVILGVAAGIGGIAIVTNRELKARLVGAKDSIINLNRSQKNFRSQLDKFKSSLDIINPLTNDINHDLRRYQFEIEAHLNKINTTLDKLKNNNLI